MWLLYIVALLGVLALGAAFVGIWALPFVLLIALGVGAYVVVSRGRSPVGSAGAAAGGPARPRSKGATTTANDRVS